MSGHPSWPWSEGDALFADALNAAFLPTSGGELFGPLSIVTTAHTALSLPNGLNFVGDFGGTPWPGIETQGAPMTFSRSAAATHGNDYLDFQFRRDTTAVTGGAGQINSCLQVSSTIGPGDASENWALTSFVNSHGSGLNVALDVGVTRQGGVGGVLGAVIVAADNTNSTLGAVGLEVDCIVQNADTETNTAMWGGIGGRVGIDVVAIRSNASQTTPRTEVNVGLWFTQSTNVSSGGGDPYINYKSLIGVGANTQAYQGLDTRGAIAPTGYSDPLAAVRMQDGQIIDFNGGSQLNSAAGNYLQHVTSGVSRLRYMAGSTEAFAVTDGGTIIGTDARIGGSTGPTWTTGSAVPASTQPVGSIYSRVGGAVGATLYVSRGSGTWAAVAGV